MHETNLRTVVMAPPEKPKSKFGGLKRLGTVIKGRRNSTHPYDSSLTSERKRSSTNIASKFGGFGKKKEAPSANTLSPQPTNEGRPSTSVSSSTPRPSDAGLGPTRSRTPSDRPRENSFLDLPKEEPAESSLVNGSHSSPRPDEAGPSFPAAEVCSCVSRERERANPY
jgi:hypothetical protein